MRAIGLPNVFRIGIEDRLGKAKPAAILLDEPALVSGTWSDA
jgi:hypothetical protein